MDRTKRCPRDFDLIQTTDDVQTISFRLFTHRSILSFLVFVNLAWNMRQQVLCIFFDEEDALLRT